MHTMDNIPHGTFREVCIVSMYIQITRIITLLILGGGGWRGGAENIYFLHDVRSGQCY